MSEAKEFPSMEDALLSDHEVTRVTARGACSWVDGFQAWLNAEQKRGTSDADLIVAFTRLFVLTHSSTVANFMKAEGFPIAAKALKDCIDYDYVRHAQMCRSHIEKLRTRR